MNQNDADKAIESVYPENRYRWCEANLCACLGCVNRTKKTAHVTKAQWEDWKKRNPQNDQFEEHRSGVGKING